MTQGLTIQFFSLANTTNSLNLNNIDGSVYSFPPKLLRLPQDLDMISEMAQKLIESEKYRVYWHVPCPPHPAL